MAKEMVENKIMYAIQCSECKKIMLPQTRVEEKELVELVVLGRVMKGWASGEVNIFSETPDAVRKFLETRFYREIGNRVYDILMRPNSCDCKDGLYEIIKCKAQRRF